MFFLATLMLGSFNFQTANADQTPIPMQETAGRAASLAEPIKIPVQYETYLDCRLSVLRKERTADDIIVRYESLNGKRCEKELKASRRQLRSDLEDLFQGQDAVSVVVDLTYNVLDKKVSSLPSSAVLLLAQLDAFGFRSFTVPDGMWEYHLCKSAGPVVLNGRVAKPKFADDTECSLSLAYSRAEALRYLQRKNTRLTRAEQQELVEAYVREIDERAMKRRGDEQTSNAQ